MKAIFVDEVGAGRSTPDDCRGGVHEIWIGDTLFKKCGDAEADRHLAESCGHTRTITSKFTTMMRGLYIQATMPKDDFSTIAASIAAAIEQGASTVTYNVKAGPIINDVTVEVAADSLRKEQLDVEVRKNVKLLSGTADYQLVISGWDY